LCTYDFREGKSETKTYTIPDGLVAIMFFEGCDHDMTYLGLVFRQRFSFGRLTSDSIKEDLSIPSEPTCVKRRLYHIHYDSVAHMRLCSKLSSLPMQDLFVSVANNHVEAVWIISQETNQFRKLLTKLNACSSLFKNFKYEFLKLTEEQLESMYNYFFNDHVQLCNPFPSLPRREFFGRFA
jgi:hypothetical protein